VVDAQLNEPFGHGLRQKVAVVLVENEINKG
jgi:hypothetical protein